MDAKANTASGVPSGVPSEKKPHLEGKRMASGDIGNVVPGNRLRVRPPCPPLSRSFPPLAFCLALCPGDARLRTGHTAGHGEIAGDVADGGKHVGNQVDRE